MSDHRIVAVAPVGAAASAECSRCAPDAPHNVVVRCECGEIASGKDDHIWTMAVAGGLATLSPSFNWLIDPRDPAKGSHLHEFVERVPITSLNGLYASMVTA